MAEIRVRTLREDDWPAYRAIRLAALVDSPDAFVATHAEETALGEADWRARMTESSGRLRNAHQVEALTANLISVNRRHKTHAGVRVTGL